MSTDWMTAIRTPAPKADPNPPPLHVAPTDGPRQDWHNAIGSTLPAEEVAQPEVEPVDWLSQFGKPVQP